MSQKKCLIWESPLDKDVESDHKEDHNFGEHFPMIIHNNIPQWKHCVVCKRFSSMHSSCPGEGYVF